MTPEFIQSLIDSPYPLEVSDADASLLVRAGLAHRVESHSTLVEASEDAWSMSEGEIAAALAQGMLEERA